MRLSKRTLHIDPSAEEFGIRLSGPKKPAPEPTPKKPAPEPPQKKGGAGRVFGRVLLALVVLIIVIEVAHAIKPDSVQKSEDDTYPGSSLGLPKITPPPFEDIFTPAEQSDASDGTETAEVSEGSESTAGAETEETTETADVLNQAIRKISEAGYIWQTGSSIAARKQFWSDKVYHYAGGQDDPFAYELVSVTNLTGIETEHGDGVEYVYDTNTGTQYYLYENDDDFLECHWEPDGYSGSDSLTKVSDNITENTPMIRMDADQTTGRTFDVRSISVFSGYYNDSDKEPCLAINLESPVYVRKTDGTDGAVHSIQIYGEAVDQFIEERGLNFEIGEADGYVVEKSSCQVTGDLFEPDTNHHYTPVIMHVTGGL